MALLTVLLVLAGGAIGGRSGMTFALVMAGVMNFVSYWFSDKIVLAMYGAQEVTEVEYPDFFGGKLLLILETAAGRFRNSVLVWVAPEALDRRRLRPIEPRCAQSAG